MTTIYFVRHAHSTYTKEERERPLSEKGYLDAENVTRLLKDKHIEVVISSPYKRAIQTVQGIAHTYKLSIQTEEDLRERLLSTEPYQILMMLCRMCGKIGVLHTKAENRMMSHKGAL